MATFDGWKYARLAKILEARGKISESAETNLKFYNGDHWQDGNGWVGPMVSPAEPGGMATMLQIKRAFVSRNAIGEMVNRHVGGVLGRELDWGFIPAHPLGEVEVVDELTGETRTEDEQPDEGEQELIDEAETLLTEWWDRREVQATLQQFAASMLLAKYGGVLRFYVLPGERDENGEVEPGDLAQSLDRIWLQHMATDEDTLELIKPSAAVYTDKKTRKEIGVFVYKEALTDEDGAAEVDRVEVTYLDDEGNTVLRIMDRENVLEETNPALPLGGRLLMYEAMRPALIGPQIVSLQKLLNLTESMKGRNVVLGGFLERIIFNAQLPGHEETDEVTGRKRFVRDPYYAGAGTTNFIRGIEIEDAEGKITYTNPSAVYRDPVSTETFDNTAQSTYLAMLQEAQQLHYALAGDAVVSGESRAQARDAFQKDLQITAGKIEAATRWILETALALASYFAGRGGEFAELRAYAQAKIDAGPISADDKRVAAELFEKGLRSEETAISETGVEDADAEKRRIAEDRASDAARRATLATAMLEQTQTDRDTEGNTFRPTVPTPGGEDEDAE